MQAWLAKIIDPHRLIKFLENKIKALIVEHRMEMRDKDQEIENREREFKNLYEAYAKERGNTIGSTFSALDYKGDECVSNHIIMQKNLDPVMTIRVLNKDTGGIYVKATCLNKDGVKFLVYADVDERDLIHTVSVDMLEQFHDWYGRYKKPSTWGNEREEHRQQIQRDFKKDGD